MKNMGYMFEGMNVTHYAYILGSLFLNAIGLVTVLMQLSQAIVVRW